MMPTILAFGMPGPLEILFLGILLLGLIVFVVVSGIAFRFVMRTLGEGVREFKKGTNGVENEPK